MNIATAVSSRTDRIQMDLENAESRQSTDKRFEAFDDPWNGPHGRSSPVGDVTTGAGRAVSVDGL